MGGQESNLTSENSKGPPRSRFWDHFKTICWLRWKLSRNQMARSGKLNKVITLIMVFTGLFLALGSTVGGFFLGFLGLAEAPSWIHLLVWDLVIGGFLFFWLFSLLIEVQRSESIDMTRLLHLPVSPAQIFVLNYLASHLSPILLVALPGMLGLSMGILLGTGPKTVFLVLSVLAFVFTITSWSYCLRGWIARLMLNKRRKRAIIVGFSMSIILLSQLPNLYFNVLRDDRDSNRMERIAAKAGKTDRRSDEWKQAFLSKESQIIHRCLPFLWPSLGAKNLIENRPSPAIFTFLGLTLFGLIGLKRGYHSTLRFYQGATSVKVSRKPDGPSLSVSTPSIFMEYQWPGLSNQVSAMTMAFLRNLLRAPEAKMALLFPLIMIIVFGSMSFRRPPENMELLHPLIPGGLAFALLFGLVQLALNQFGWDRSGFRNLVLLPVARADVLKGKNLALLALSFPLYLLMQAGITIALGFAWDVFLAGILQFISGFIFLSLLGNWSSSVAPLRVATGSLKRSKSRPSVSLLMVGFSLIFPLVMIPIMVPAIIQVVLHGFGVTTGIPWAFLGSLVLAIGALFLYRGIIGLQGQLLARREKDILVVVTHEQE